MIKLDFTNKLAAQDMIRIVMQEKKIAEVEAIEFSINGDIHQKILKEGYAAIAYDLWGHDNPERKWEKTVNPIIEIELDEQKENLIKDVVKRYDVDYETSVCYFLIFTMDFFGYHI